MLASIKRSGYIVFIRRRNHDWQVTLDGYTPSSLIRQVDDYFIADYGGETKKALTFQDAVFKAADTLISMRKEEDLRNDTRKSADTWMKEHAVDEAS